MFSSVWAHQIFYSYYCYRKSKPLILFELRVFCYHIYTHTEAASLYPCVSSFINITVGTRTKIQFMYLNDFKKLMTDAQHIRH